MFSVQLFSTVKSCLALVPVFFVSNSVPFYRMDFSVLCFVLLLWNWPVFVASLNEEGLALLSFKRSLKEFPESFFTSWNSSDETPCSWLGVTCKAQRVIYLSIANRRLSGTLPSDLGKLTAIRHLNLRDNNLFGSLPSDLFNATELRSLILSGNSLSGHLPPQIGKLNRLLHLDLSHNSFNDSIPSPLVQCKRLKTLSLNENSFSGPLPIGLGTNLTTLEKLDISSNRLTGPIPGDFGSLVNLKATLDMSHNSFTGPIPESLGKIPQRVYINLSYNNLSGPIPQVSTLLNAGPTAFLGNPFLCGPPLKLPCPPDASVMNSLSLIHHPFRYPGGNSAKDGKHGHLVFIIILVTGIILGTCFFGGLVSYLYKKVYASKGAKMIGGCNFEERSIVRADMFCFAKASLETLSQNMEQYSFVRLDQQIDFTLDQLLTASAFLLGKSGLGIVYKVVLENGLTLAVRRLGEGGTQRLKDYQTEVEAIGKIKHPNIVALRAYCWSVEEKLLIYDYEPNGDLATALHGSFLSSLLFDFRLFFRFIALIFMLQNLMTRESWDGILHTTFLACSTENHQRNSERPDSSP